MYDVYILKSEKNGKFYIGYSENITKRLRQHNRGENKSTKSGIPWKIIYIEQCENKRSSWLRERQIKSYKGGAAFKKLLG
ncbi:MAG: endonuclease [Candidatus Harrisonbacteria bacterium CG10_big_fil_rev_8_21_14_0_10_45_28]|uniref:Endonuclease n=1 Tax=Candidatus Harrisonbacteria bacterium CG10_big_fil_rev_8_21_14_0_10_45_28 TaxID=1974586 RepID=A0A2H0UNP2_9BACT|nr:MAG: endonuclease [Candidatus Harrisonbacteria bacterium CG10_big_fil_rev_8_21_14_0_10_45_28]